ncbi:MAG: phosphoglycerate dehydrogenase [Phycisphaeraceae bacterium]|nr:phosphoglycerate dehydrogenase [Phycisphaeraceae bacterium]
MTAIQTPRNVTQVFKILAADKLAPEGLKYVEQQDDAELVNKPGLSEDELAKIVGEHDAMIVRSGVKVTAKVLEKPGRLKVIARAGVGVDNIDCEAATKHGILVVNTADASTITTAEHAFALMMALNRNIGPAYKKFTEGGWDRNKFEGHQLAGKTLGVVGFGRIGQTVARRAMAFEMDVVAYDPFINAQTMLDGKVKMFSQFADMLPHVDMLTFHVPLNDQTRGMLNAETFAQCRDGVLVINAARGGVVDETALIAAIDSGKCGGAAIDVFTKEPPPADHPLRTHPKVLCTPHLGASTEEAQQAVSVDAAAACLTYLRGEGIKGAVNAGGLRIDLSPEQAAYADLADRMAQLISPMVTRGISQVCIELVGKQLEGGKSMIERSALVALLRGHLSDPVNIINVNRVAEARGITVRTTTVEEDRVRGEQLVLEVIGPPDAVDSKTQPADRTRRIVGRVYDDMKPRVVEINGYHMDMIPAGDMIVLQNDDRPGMIGIVGTLMGKHKVNIADMTISRRPNPEGPGATALMVFKIDAAADKQALEQLKASEGILKVAAIKLPEEK